ncbi:hypothetical protein 035JT004_52 [Bacillus phage 035JT004]|nr:hypothetical protein 035JT004_52 [Bacillus phage 035JT004]
MNIIDELKEKLKATVEGKVLVRQNRKFKGLELEGVLCYDVYYNTPTEQNKETIQKVVEGYGFETFNHRAIDGAYGFVMHFRTKNS